MTALAAVTLSGCMGRPSAPVAYAYVQQPRSDLDAMAYGGPPPAAQQQASQPQQAYAQQQSYDQQQVYAQQVSAQQVSAQQQVYAQQAPAQQTYAQQQPLAPQQQSYNQQQGDVPQQVYAPPPQRGVLNSGGGALAALGAGFRAGRGSAQGNANQGYTSQGNYQRQAAYAPPVATYDSTYRLDAGDKLRIVVYGQEGLTNSYAIGATGSITMPLIGNVSARGNTPSGLATEIAGRLRNGFIREPSVAVEIEAYRPFFILGEVAAPGQYPYVPNMSVESAVAIAGGFSPRAKRDAVTLTHGTPEGLLRAVVPVATPLSPGDTILVGERWF